MCKVIVFMADGMEETECLTAVDILRRGGVTVDTVSVSDDIYVTSSHNVTVRADYLFSKADFNSCDMLFLPGGMPGVTNLGRHNGLCALLKEYAAAGKRIAAVCAAPSLLGELGLLKGKSATCYPGFEDKLKGAVYTNADVVTDGNITTGRGLGYSIDLAIEMLSLLKGKAPAEKVSAAIQHP